MSGNGLAERRLDGLRTALGPLVLRELADPDVVEVMLNPDGRLWREKLGVMMPIGEMSRDDGLALLRQVASSLDETVTKDNPFVEGELALDGSRFEGISPPVVEGPTFAIRKKAAKVFTFADYVKAGILDPEPVRDAQVAEVDRVRFRTAFEVADYFRRQIQDRKNILVVGGTGSGKTTFCNGFLHCLSEVAPDDRIVLMEDTRELQCTVANKVFLRATEAVSMLRLLRATMRLRPDRIAVGEVRDKAALDLLKAWNTGHPGGFATVHANSAYGGLTRLDQLIQEGSSAPQRPLIAEAVNVVVFISRSGTGRRVREILEVVDFDARLQKFEVVRRM